MSSFYEWKAKVQKNNWLSCVFQKTKVRESSQKIETNYEPRLGAELHLYSSLSWGSSWEEFIWVLAHENWMRNKCTKLWDTMKLRVYVYKWTVTKIASGEYKNSQMKCISVHFSRKLNSYSTGRTLSPPKLLLCFPYRYEYLILISEILHSCQHALINSFVFLSRSH